MTTYHGTLKKRTTRLYRCVGLKKNERFGAQTFQETFGEIENNTSFCSNPSQILLFSNNNFLVS